MKEMKNRLTISLSAEERLALEEHYEVIRQLIISGALDTRFGKVEISFHDGVLHSINVHKSVYRRKKML